MREREIKREIGMEIKGTDRQINVERIKLN